MNISINQFFSLIFFAFVIPQKETSRIIIQQTTQKLLRF